MVTDVTDRKRAEQQLKASQEQLSELSRHMESVREEERTRIAREIHDELGQTLVTLKVYLSWLVRRLPQAQEVASEQVKPMYALIDSGIQTVSRLSTELRPGALDDLGLTRAIEWQVNEFRKWTNLEFHVVSRPKHFEADPETVTALFRIAHEAITNVVRHARATRVDITIKKKRSGITMTVSDDGIGITEDQLQNKRAFGLMGMKERARLLAGTVNISGVPGHGTTVEAFIPQRSRESKP
jgi:two-component system sensor histidine kinase UhpB